MAGNPTILDRIEGAVFDYAQNIYSKRFGTAAPQDIFADIDPSLASLPQPDYDVVISELAGILTKLGFTAHLQPETLKNNAKWSSLCIDLKGSLD
jgi:hypothetical protein